MATRNATPCDTISDSSRANTAVFPAITCWLRHVTNGELAAVPTTSQPRQLSAVSRRPPPRASQTIIRNANNSRASDETDALRRDCWVRPAYQWRRVRRTTVVDDARRCNESALHAACASQRPNILNYTVASECAELDDPFDTLHITRHCGVDCTATNKQTKRKCTKIHRITNYL